MSEAQMNVLQGEVNGSNGLATAPCRVLTSRELQVLQMMADGLSTKDIASRLNVSFKTAATHRANVLGKLGVHETVSAVRWAIRSGIVEP